MDGERETSVKYASMKEMGLRNPEQRLKDLSNSISVQIDYNQPFRRYYRTGIEMMRMADVYMKELSLENAYTLYLKYITIFLEKIQKHPEYNTVSVEQKTTIKKMLRDALKNAESLKVILLERFMVDYVRYMANAKRREKAELERLEQERKQRLKEEEDRRNKLAAAAAAKAAKSAVNVSLIGGQDPTIPKPSAPPLSPMIATENDPLPDPSTADKRTPTIDRSTKPPPAIHDEHALRDVVLPSKLMQEFLKLAFKNTANNKETCGILAGKLERNKLLITHLLIPQQTGSPDFCTTDNEEDIFNYQDQHSLITLGWIHTHPTQTAFLSSVDLHTHCSYQLMMAEAIAIVCAPKYDETGFFMLTPEYGLNYIASCRQSGFHLHPNDVSLYTKAMHCKPSPEAEVIVVDLRKN